MPAPKGNKHALGNNGGRPRKHDLSEEAKLLMEFADNPESLILREFALERKYDCQERMNDYATESVEFREAYNYARSKIGARREKLAMKNKINHTVYHRYASIYDKELKAHDKEMKEAANPQPAAVTIQLVHYGDPIQDNKNTPQV